MEKLTVTLKGVTHTFDIEVGEANIYLALVKACGTFGLEGTEFKFVPASQMAYSVEGEGKQIAA